MAKGNPTKNASAITSKTKSGNRRSQESLLEDLRSMLLIRRFEERAGQLYGMGLIGGFCHLYIGQEAVVTGLQGAALPNDSVVTSYRDHGHMLACGMDPKGVMAELTGRSDGFSRGKGGSMHMFSREKSFYGGHGIVGAQVPVGTGLAFAHKYRKDNGVSFAYYGDGAANQGQVHESFNMAAIWGLPVIFVIENNQYGMGTPSKRISAGYEALSDRGRAYGLQAFTVDGMDVIKVRQVGLEAAELARSGKPLIIEAKTYRYRGHSMSDPARYRSKEEVQEMRTEHDPIGTLQNVLIRDYDVDEDTMKAIDKDVRSIVQEAAAFAQESPEPDPSGLMNDIYAPA